jgi:glycosyltransferase involved in cell wall biosynthesis
MLGDHFAAGGGVSWQERTRTRTLRAGVLAVWHDADRHPYPPDVGALGEAVTAVVPTRDRLELLRMTLWSILRQRDVDVRVVVVDEASSDGTPAYLAELAGSDERVRFVRHDEPKGAAGARNAGVALAETPWVAFCDDDDLWHPEKLRLQLAAAGDRCWVAAGAVMVDTRLELVDHTRLEPGDGEMLAALLSFNTIPAGGSGVAVRRDAIERAGGFRESLRNSEDWDLWIRVAQQGPVAVADRPLVAYRIWPGSKSRSAANMERAWDDITSTYRPLADELGVVPDRPSHRRYLAKQQIRNRNRPEALRLLRIAADGRRLWYLPRAAAAVAIPGVMDRIGTRRAKQGIPADWRVDAEGWLAELSADAARDGLSLTLP